MTATAWLALGAQILLAVLQAFGYVAKAQSSAEDRAAGAAESQVEAQNEETARVTAASNADAPGGVPDAADPLDRDSASGG